MSKYRYVANGIACIGGHHFIGECISDDIIKAIILFREHEFMLSVHSIQRKEQVNANTNIGIISIKPAIKE